MQIPVEISVGCEVVFTTPAYIPKGGGMPQVEIINSIVTKIKTRGSDKWIYAELPNKKSKKQLNICLFSMIPDWRINQFTYGGIWMYNHKFDQRRIDTQDMKLLQP